MAGNDLMLAGLWKGLNRRVAPYLLPESQSPDTTDAGSDLNVIGLLGPRKGRTRIFNRAFNIMGVGSANFPWGRQRVVVTDDGTWENFAVPWPAALTPQQASVVGMLGASFDMIDAGTITQIGGGTTESAEMLLSPSINLSQYQYMNYDINSPYGTRSQILNTVNSDWTVKFKLKIDNVYYDSIIIEKSGNNISENKYDSTLGLEIGRAHV